MKLVLPRIDHVHVYVSNRAAAEDWYKKVLGLRRIAEMESWACDGGPLMIGNATGTIQLALFERPAANGRSTIAFGTSGEEFLAWQAHLSRVLGGSCTAVDHQMAWSLYFADPDENTYEITSYDYQVVAQGSRKASSEQI